MRPKPSHAKQAQTTNDPVVAHPAAAAAPPAAAPWAARRAAAAAARPTWRRGRKRSEMAGQLDGKGRKYAKMAIPKSFGSFSR